MKNQLTKKTEEAQDFQIMYSKTLEQFNFLKKSQKSYVNEHILESYPKLNK